VTEPVTDRADEIDLDRPLPADGDWPWLLDPDVVFLNHGSFGSCPAPVMAAQRRVREQLEREPVRFFTRELEGRLDAARAALAAFVGAAAEDVAFVPNATTAVNTALRSLRLGAGDELLVTDHGYAACRNAALFVAERSGARVVTARVPFPLASADQVVDAVVGAVRSRTRAALIDHVTSPTGLVFPVERLTAALAGRGVEVLIDGAHAPGMVPLDVGALARAGAAVYTGNLHKWVCAPKGAAFLWVRRDRQPDIRPLVVSHGATSPRTDRSRFLLELDWPGTHDPSAYLAVPDALRFLASLAPGGVPALRARNRALALAARRVLVEALGGEAPAPDEMIGSLAAVPLPAAGAALPGGEIDPLQQELVARFAIQVPIPHWPASPRRVVRVSAHAYNTLGQYRVLARALVELLRADAA
jgi:isopenicillin-N epimerase